MNGNINYEKIGKSIKSLRNEKKITQVELGNLISKSESSIRKYEKGLIEIPNSVLQDIAKALDVTYWELLGVENIDSGIILNEYTRLDLNEKPKLIKYEELNNQYEYVFKFDVSLKTTEVLHKHQSQYILKNTLNNSRSSKVMERADYIKLDYIAVIYLILYISNTDNKHQYFFDGLYALNEKPFQDIYEKETLKTVKIRIVEDTLKTEKLKDFNLTFSDLEEINKVDYSKK